METLATISPYVRLAHDYLTPPRCAHGPARILDHALHYFHAGAGTYTVQGRSYPILPGKAFFVRPGITFEFRAATPEPLHMWNLHFDPVQSGDSELITWPYPSDGETRDREAACNESAPLLPDELIVSTPAVYERLFFRVHALFGLRDPVSALQMKGAMIELLAYLLQAERLQTLDERARRHGEDLKRAVNFMQRHRNENITLDDVAEVAGLSKSHFAALFKMHYAVSPIRFLANLRLDFAKKELAFQNTPIKAVAAAAGYSSVHHFTRAFKKDAGITPAQFRTLGKR